jgi:hypothetical protein
MPLWHKEVGSIYHDYYLRIKNGNLPFLDNIVFSPDWVNTDHLSDAFDTIIVWPGWYPDGSDRESTRRDPWPFHTKTKVRIITASPEYDQFHKSYYEQENETLTSGDLGVVFQPNRVFSNIENGLGIFAGMNETHILFDVPKKDD